MAYLTKQQPRLASAARNGGIRPVTLSRAAIPAPSFTEAKHISHLVAQIEDGFPYSALDDLHKSSGLPLETIATLIRLPARTLSRRRAAGRLKPDESDRLLRISRIVDQATALFEGDKHAAMQWLQTPQPGLSDERPLTFARTELGARAVEDLIGRLEHGVFS